MATSEQKAFENISAEERAAARFKVERKAQPKGHLTPAANVRIHAARTGKDVSADVHLAKGNGSSNPAPTKAKPSTARQKVKGVRNKSTDALEELGLKL